MEAGLQKNFDIAYNWELFDGEQGPGDGGEYAYNWTHPLFVDDTAEWIPDGERDQTRRIYSLRTFAPNGAFPSDSGGYCSLTIDNTWTHPGYWFVKFKDNTARHVSKIRLWGPGGGAQNRLSGACVRFNSANGGTPKKTAPETDCDLYLPDIGSDTGVGTGTDVKVDRKIYGMMLISTADDRAMQVCGIKIYREDARKMHTFDNGQLVAEQSSTWPEYANTGEDAEAGRGGGKDGDYDANQALQQSWVKGKGEDRVIRAAASAVAHTNLVENEDGWWRVRFMDGQPRYVSAVKLWNRYDCCKGRLSFAEVLLDDETERAFRLPNIAQSGTVVDISREFTTLKIRNDACT